ncbi:MAG: hypothetical protein ACPMAQ_09195 [Phycisphaerae bacterium]
MSQASLAIDLFREAAELNRRDSLRHGSLLELPNYGQVIMTGDLHGHRRNFQKLTAYCQLEKTPVRHVLLHELIHEEPITFLAHDHSVELLIDAARWKTFFPDQVHFLQSNHELAQLNGHDITKGGRSVAEDFDAGVEDLFGPDEAEDVRKAIDEFLASFPVAARSPNRIFFSHSLPGREDLGRFDPQCVYKPPEELDLSEGGDVYRMVWGRRHDAALLETLARAWDVDLFIVGHQPQEWGHEVMFGRLLILASDHNHGVFLPIDLRKKYTMDDLVARIRKYASVE